MKSHGISKSISYPISIIGILFALTNTEVKAGAMGPVELAAPGKVYVGVFGGAGASNKTDINQYGTAYYLDSLGGPLAVNAFGQTNSRNFGLVGGHVGYQWMEILLNSFNSQSSLTPAVELEGYYLGKSKFTGHNINNQTARITEHDFIVTYPMSTGVFLGNAVLNFNPSNFNRWHPYVSAGIGSALTSISMADATQVSPPEPGINHYNSNSSDTVSTFAAQAKAGLNFDLSKNVSILLEYRWLYLANTSYTFGSTVYPGHPETSSWLVKLGPQYYNMGAIGIQYSI